MLTTLLLIPTSRYADGAILTLNANKTRSMYFAYTDSTNIPSNIFFMHEPIGFVNIVQILGIFIFLRTFIIVIHVYLIQLDMFIFVQMRFYLILPVVLVILNLDICPPPILFNFYGYSSLLYGIIVRIVLTIWLLHGAKSCVDCGNYRT